MLKLTLCIIVSAIICVAYVITWVVISCYRDGMKDE